MVDAVRTNESSTSASAALAAGIFTAAIGDLAASTKGLRTMVAFNRATHSLEHVSQPARVDRSRPKCGCQLREFTLNTDLYLALSGKTIEKR